MDLQINEFMQLNNLSCVLTKTMNTSYYVIHFYAITYKYEHKVAINWNFMSRAALQLE